MRILYIDIDTLRPDHLGCYGYHRDTSPNIDGLAGDGMRFENCHSTDVPCMPSRTSLFSGRFGIHNGVINHGGEAGEPFVEGREREFHSTLGKTNWMTCLREAGIRTVTVSPFAERHSAWWWYAGFSEMHNPGNYGHEIADEVSPTAIDWIKRNGDSDDWFLHVNMWDPHTPYRVPREQGNLFKDSELPSWYSEEIRKGHWGECGPHSARACCDWDWKAGKDERYDKKFPRQPMVIDSMETARAMFDGYDMGVHYADEHTGRILNALADAGVLDDTVVMVSSDHGENLGELNIYGDHQTACNITTRVPLIVRWPGVTDGGRVDGGLHYHFDWAATLTEMAGGKVPGNWDGVAFTDAFKSGKESGRDYLVVSQGAWSCQRGVRFRDGGKDYICMRVYHDGYHNFPDVMLFNLTDDPHHQRDIAKESGDLVNKAMGMLSEWHSEMMRTSVTGVDPMWTVMREGGSLHTRGELPSYLEVLRSTGRGRLADELAAKHPDEAVAP